MLNKIKKLGVLLILPFYVLYINIKEPVPFRMYFNIYYLKLMFEIQYEKLLKRFGLTNWIIVDVNTLLKEIKKNEQE